MKSLLFRSLLSHPALLLLLLCGLLAPGCGGADDDDTVATSLTDTCDEHADCIEETDDYDHCGTAEADGFCCVRGSMKCGCELEDNGCRPGLTCMETGIWADGSFCMPGFADYMGWDPVE